MASTSIEGLKRGIPIIILLYASKKLKAFVDKISLYIMNSFNQKKKQLQKVCKRQADVDRSGQRIKSDIRLLPTVDLTIYS